MDSFPQTNHPQTPVRSTRRRRYSARYLSYVHDATNIMHDDDPSSDDAAISRPKKHSHSSRHLADNQADAPNQLSDVQTTAPSSPYDADEEDEGEHYARKEAISRKRSSPRPPSKQSRQMSSRRSSRKHSSNLAVESGCPSTLEHADMTHTGVTLPISPKESPSARAMHCDRNPCDFRAEPNVPGIKLWDHHNKVLVPDKVLISELGQVLTNNKHYAIYVGQDETYIKYPSGVLGLAKPLHQERWMNELRKPPQERRVMIVDPKSAKLLGPRECPTLGELPSYLVESGKERSRESRRRVFNAHYTDSYGFAQGRWDSMFAVPPPVSHQVTNNAAHDEAKTSASLQSHPKVPSLRLRRTLRQMKSVRYAEASSDSVEFLSSESDKSTAEAPQTSRKKESPKRSRSSSFLSTSSASYSGDLELQFDKHFGETKHRGRIFRDIFPTSSSEHERIEVPDMLSPNQSSDESDVAQNIQAPGSSAQRHTEDENVVSPASVLMLDQTPTLKLQKLYSLHDSSASEDSLSEVLNGNCVDGVHSVDASLSPEGTKPSQNSLRLQLSNRLQSDAQTVAKIGLSRNKAESISLSLRARDSRPNGKDRNYAFRDVQNNQTTQRSDDPMRVERTPAVARPRIPVGEVPSLRHERHGSTEVMAKVAHFAGSNDVRRIQNSNEALPRRNSIRKKKSNRTNENFVSKLVAKNREGAEDEICGGLPYSGTSSSLPAHIVATRSRKAPPCQLLHPKEPDWGLLVKESRGANAEGVQSNDADFGDDSKTSHVEEQTVPRASATGIDVVPKTAIAQQRSEEVYLWDYATKKRSNTLVPLTTALKLCAVNKFKMIYDGQDLKSGDKRFGNIWNETKAWISRKGTRPPLKRKVRVWDHCTGSIEKYCFSPPMYDVEQWLKDNPSNSLFRPSLYLQYEARFRIKQAKGTGSSVRCRVTQAIQDQVLSRIKHLRVTQLSEGPQRQVVLWNSLKRLCEPPRDFASRPHLTRFLFSNPALELLRGQDELFRLESSTEFKLIRVTDECPEGYICFWDTRSGATCARPKKGETNQMRSVKERIASEPGLKVYIGQDRSDTERIRGMIAIAKCSSAVTKRVCSSSYALVRCGNLLQTHVFSEGWVPKYIETQKESAFCAAFWSKSRKALIVEPLEAARESVDDYLNAYSDLELYVGQDLPLHVQEQLHRWFTVLKYEPGTDANSAAPVLLRYSLLPLKYRALRFTSGDEFRITRKPVKPNRKRKQGELEAGPEDDLSTGDKRTDLKRQRLSFRVNKRSEDERIHNASVTSFSDEEEVLENGRAEETEFTRDRSQDTTNYDEENLDGSSGPGCSSTPSGSSLDDSCSESGSESETGICGKEDTSVPFPEPDAEDHIRSATKAVKKMICVIREAGPKVLKRELIHDVRQHIREQLILEVESIEHLITLVKDFASYDFAAVANEICEDMQLLDVHGCFSCSAELGYTPIDLSSIREDLDAGRICTSHGVIKRFREVCAGLIQFHDGTLLHGQAALLRSYGEELIARFQKSHALHLEKEQRMLCVFRICERAKHIGFRTGQRNRKAKSVSNSLSLVSSEPSLRVSGRQPEVTFLNYRDEKGNSVMGKRPSVRVFGFTIDTTALEKNIGNFRPCHVCRKDVVLSQANSMRCSNSIFNICDEVLCKECLETVFSLEQDEFKVLRDAENWFCVHCRGLCPSGSECMTALVSKGLCSPTTTCRFRFVWPYERNHSDRVAVVISRRQRNGEYDPFPRCLPEQKYELAHDVAKNDWFTFMDLEIGAYRCQVMVDNIWMASTTFHVLPSATGSASAYQQEERSSMPPTNVSYFRGAHPNTVDISTKLSARTRPRGPRIRWHSVLKGSVHAVHAIRDKAKQDGGTLVKACSRTEGYDWRRAKRPATLQWVPELLPADESHGSQQGNRKDLILCAIDSERAHLAAADSPPRPGTNESHRDFMITLNTFRYNKMLKSLWSIVTGRSNIHGIGLFTLSGYKKGDFVIEYAGDLIRTPLADIREARYEAAGLGTYLFKINEDQIVDATVESNRARFTNHSCDPNMVADIVHVQGRDLIVLRATREIPKFTELTFDYKFPYEEAKVQCLCNSWNCVGVMN